jgi:hypothetical protein
MELIKKKIDSINSFYKAMILKEKISNLSSDDIKEYFEACDKENSK